MKKIFSAELWAISALLPEYFETTKATTESKPSAIKKETKATEFPQSSLILDWIIHVA